MSNGAQKKPLVFRVNDHGQGPELLHQVFLERGWIEYDEDVQEETDWNLWWRTSRFRMCDYENIQPWQRLNHYPKSTGITRKDCLVRHLKRMKGVHGSGMYNFSPLSFNLPNDYTRFVAEYGKLKAKIDPKQFAWICKPADMSRGRGIFLFRDISELQYDCNAVVQQYIANPLLIGGYKFDIRLYVAVPSFHPLTVYVFQEGIVRFSTEKYDLSTLNNVFSHLTNTSINKHSPSYTTDKERIGPGCKWTLTQLRYYFHQNSLDDRLLWARIANIIVLTLLIQAPQVPKEKNCYELYGFDILVDDKMKPWLLEVNFSPALSTDCQTDLVVKKPMIHDLMDMLNFKDNDADRGGMIKQLYTGRVTARGRLSANKNRPEPIDRTTSSSRLSQRGSIQRMNSTISNTLKGIEPPVIEQTLSFIQQDNPSINKTSEEKMCYGLPLVNPSDDEKDDSDCESVQSSTKSDGIEPDIFPLYPGRSNLCTPTPIFTVGETDLERYGTMSSIVKKPESVHSLSQRGDKMSLKSFGNSDSAYSSFSDNSDKVPIPTVKNSKNKLLNHRRKSFTIQSSLQKEVLPETPKENGVFKIKSLRPNENSRSLRKVSNRGATTSNVISFRSKSRVSVPHVDKSLTRSRNFERGPSRSVERGPSRAIEQGPSRTFERGPSRTHERGPSRNFERGPSRNFEHGPTRNFDSVTASVEQNSSRNITGRNSSRFGHVASRSDIDVVQKNRAQMVVSSMSTISRGPKEKETLNLGLNAMTKKNPTNRFRQKSKIMSMHSKPKGPPPRVGEFFLVFPFNEGTHKAANTTLDPHIVIKETQKLFKELKMEVDKNPDDSKVGGILPFGNSPVDDKLWAPIKQPPEEI